MSRTGWTTAELAQVYRDRGLPSPVEEACGPGKSKFGVDISQQGRQERTVDGITFDSKAEMQDYLTLKIAVQAGVITKLELQPRYLLQDAFTDASGRKHRAIYYKADFRYVNSEGKIVVADRKGHKTQAYRLKAKLFRVKYPDIEFQEWQ